MEEGEGVLATRIDDHGYNSLTVLGIVEVIEVFLTVAAEVLAYLDGQGEHHSLLVKDGGAFKRANAC